MNKISYLLSLAENQQFHNYTPPQHFDFEGMAERLNDIAEIEAVPCGSFIDVHTKKGKCIVGITTNRELSFTYPQGEHSAVIGNEIDILRAVRNFAN